MYKFYKFYVFYNKFYNKFYTSSTSSTFLRRFYTLCICVRQKTQILTGETTKFGAVETVDVVYSAS